MTKSSPNSGFDLILPTQQENMYLEQLDGPYTEFSEMSVSERQFINSIVRRYKPKKLLELGVSGGSASVVLLNAISDTADAKLYSIDYSTDYYLDHSKPTGFVVDFYPKLQKRWQLYTGGLAIEFLEKIGGKIDLCLIDTVHTLPGEVMDTLMVLPYLTNDAIIIYHDVSIHTWRVKNLLDHDIRSSFTNGLMLSSLSGQKLLQKDFDFQNTNEKTYFPNIAAVKINKHTKENTYGLFHLLTILWNFLPSQSEQQRIIAFLSKHYDPYSIDVLKQIFHFQRNISCWDRILTATSNTVKVVSGQLLPDTMFNLFREVKNRSRRKNIAWAVKINDSQADIIEQEVTETSS